MWRPDLFRPLATKLRTVTLLGSSAHLADPSATDLARAVSTSFFEP